MDSRDRRAAVRDYKERKVTSGVYAVRRLSTGEAWVGVTNNLAQQENGTRFGLKMGSHPNRELRAAIQADGADGFAFEALEAVDRGDLGEIGLKSLLQDREQHWRAVLQARKIA